MGRRGIPLGSKMSAEPSLDEDEEEECASCGGSCGCEDEYDEDDLIDNRDTKYSDFVE